MRIQVKIFGTVVMLLVVLLVIVASGHKGEAIATAQQTVQTNQNSAWVASNPSNQVQTVQFTIKPRLMAVKSEKSVQ